MAADRIRVLPGSILSLHSPPPPPSQPPPQPVHLCKIAVIGDSSSGKTCLVDKFLLRKSCAAPLHHNTGTYGSSLGGGVQWCNASTTSQGTFGSAVGASLGPGAVEATLAEYSKKDIALNKSRNNSRRLMKILKSTRQPSPCQCQEETEEMTTCVRAQVWDINVPQSAIITTSQDINNCNGKNSSNSVNSTATSSIGSPPPTATPTATSTSSTAIQYNPTNNLAPLLPLLKRINGIILTCQCPSPPSVSIISPPSYNNNQSNNPNSNDSASSSNNNNSLHSWQELELLEVQIANWVNFIQRYVVVNDNGVTASDDNGDCGTDSSSNNKSSNSSNNNNNNKPYKIFIMLTFADLAISQYSPNEWMRLSVKMEEICAKFEMIHSWRMGTCVSSSCGVGVVVDNDDGDGEAAQQQQYGLFQRLAQQQQQMMEEMEDSVEALFIDLILMHLEGASNG